MAKSKKRKKPKASKTQHRILNREQISVTVEAEYIISRAKEYDSRVVSFGPLVFFSSETGDAWMIDPEDHFALCLAQGGEPQPYGITETTTNFKIEWTADYQIEGDGFIVMERSGQTKSILGYPTNEILRAINQVK